MRVSPRSVAARIESVARCIVLRSHGVELGDDLRITGRTAAFIHAGSAISLGDRVALNSRLPLNTLAALGPNSLRTIRPGASITIGADTGLTSTNISAGLAVSIGDRVLVGAGTIITDCDHHPIGTSQAHPRRFRGLPEPREDRPVTIEDDVFIGARCILLKGTHIGHGSVVGAGSVVSGTIPPMSVAVGNPCRVVRSV